MKAIGISDIGRCRKNNEDAYYVSADEMPLDLFIVADGMGGCNAGEVASSVAIEAFLNCVKQEWKTQSKEELPDLLADGITAANRAVYEKSNTDRSYAEMGTTFVAAAIDRQKLYVVHVGDSRAYLYRKKALMPLTCDHSYVMELVKMGSITKEEAASHPKKNIITRAIGIRDAVEADLAMETLQKGDYLLLCTDGLSGMLKDEEIVEILAKKMSLENKAQRLVEKANERGGFDNISLILVDIGGKD